MTSVRKLNEENVLLCLALLVVAPSHPLDGEVFCWKTKAIILPQYLILCYNKLTTGCFTLWNVSTFLFLQNLIQSEDFSLSVFERIKKGTNNKVIMKKISAEFFCIRKPRSGEWQNWSFTSFQRNSRNWKNRWSGCRRVITSWVQRWPTTLRPRNGFSNYTRIRCIVWYNWWSRLYGTAYFAERAKALKIA